MCMGSYKIDLFCLSPPLSSSLQAVGVGALVQTQM